MKPPLEEVLALVGEPETPAECEAALRRLEALPPLEGWDLEDVEWLSWRVQALFSAAERGGLRKGPA